MYQYNLAGAKDHYIGLMQTETAGPEALVYISAHNWFLVALLSTDSPHATPVPRRVEVARPRATWPGCGMGTCRPRIE